MRLGLGPAMALVAVAFAGCTGPMGMVADVPEGQIDGAVVGPLLDPYGGLPVRLVELDRTDLTSRLGGFTFRDVPVGVYTLEAQHATTKVAVATVTVTEDHVTRIILQLFPLDPPLGIRDDLVFRGGSGTEVAMPGQKCEGCEWEIPLSEDPEEVVIGASWPDFAGRRSPLTIDIYDSDGLVRSMEGTSPLRTSISGSDIGPGEGHLRMSVHFSGEFVPQPDFQLDAWAELYFGATRAQYLGQQ